MTAPFRPPLRLGLFADIQRQPPELTVSNSFCSLSILSGAAFDTVSPWGITSMSLNAIKVERLKPKTADYRVADGDSLYLLVRPNGTKLWRYDYRLGGDRRTLSIGEYNAEGDAKATFTLKQARAEHEDACKEVKAGRHPVS